MTSSKLSKKILEIKDSLCLPHYNFLPTKQRLKISRRPTVKDFQRRSYPTGRISLEKVLFSLIYKDYTLSFTVRWSATTIGLRAIAVKPKTWSADEPTLSVRPRVGRWHWCHLATSPRRSATYGCRNLWNGLARDVANHVIFMDGGHIIEELTPWILQQPKRRTNQTLHGFSSDATYCVEYMI